MIRAAIVGLGWWGKTLVEAVADSQEIRFVAGATRTMTADVQSFAGDHGLQLAESYDALLANAAQQVDVMKRRGLLEQAERTALADHPLIPLYFYVNKHLVKPEVRGWYDNVMNIYYSAEFELGRSS